MKNLAIVSIVTLVLAFALGVYATTLDYTWNPQAGDAILSADVRQDHAEAESAVNNIDSTNISDSSITYAEMGANSINATHLAPGAVRAVHIDSGAIMFDTQIAFNAISAGKLISSTDTAGNFCKIVSGYYYGDGTESRVIYSTAPTTADSFAGVDINMTMIRLELCGVTSLGHSGGYIATSDGFSDSYVICRTTAEASDDLRVYPIEGSAIWGGYGNGAFLDTSDSHGFYVNASTSVPSANETRGNATGELYVWTAWGY